MQRFECISGFRALFCGAMVAAAIVTLAPSVNAKQSSQGQQAPLSLGEVAKRARAEKQGTPTAKKVWTNDNIPTNPSAISIVGPPPAVEEKAEADDEAKSEKKPAAAAEKPKSLKEMEAELVQAQEKLALHEKELDLSKRDAALQLQAFFVDPRANQDEAGQAQLAEVQKHLDTMQQDLEAERVHVAELQAKVEEMKKAPAAPGGEPGNF